MREVLVELKRFAGLALSFFTEFLTAGLRTITDLFILERLLELSPLFCPRLRCTVFDGFEPTEKLRLLDTLGEVLTFIPFERPPAEPPNPRFDDDLLVPGATVPFVDLLLLDAEAEKLFLD